MEQAALPRHRRGFFKNALDWLQVLADADPPFRPASRWGLVATAAGTHALQAVNTMEFVVRALRGWTVPFVVPIARAYQAFDRDGVSLDAALSRQLHTLGLEVVAASRLLSPSPARPERPLPPSHQCGVRSTTAYVRRTGGDL